MNIIQLLKNRIHKILINVVKKGIAEYDDKSLYWHNLEFFLMRSALSSTILGISNENYFSNSKVIISLTTYGKRIYDVYLAIESIMQQTIKPNLIILWLEDELKNADLPITLQNQMKRGLQIRYCKNIKSFKKLIPTLHHYPDDIIITIDDDVIFSYDMIENMLSDYKRNPNFIYSNRMHRIHMIDDCTADKYVNWEFESNNPEVSALNFPTGCGGILYPPHSLDQEVLNENAFMELCPKGDDIWFKAMSLMNNVQCRLVHIHTPYMKVIDRLQGDGLCIENVDGGLNDIQFNNVFKKYNLYTLLHS